MLFLCFRGQNLNKKVSTKMVFQPFVDTYFNKSQIHNQHFPTKQEKIPSYSIKTVSLSPIRIIFKS